MASISRLSNPIFAASSSSSLKFRSNESRSVVDFHSRTLLNRGLPSSKLSIRRNNIERSSLMYYYAVVGCDSSETGDYLYKACDGFELERSSNVLDLRFIPDYMEFKHPPRDVATKIFQTAISSSDAYNEQFGFA